MLPRYAKSDRQASGPLVRLRRRLARPLLKRLVNLPRPGSLAHLSGWQPAKPDVAERMESVVEAFARGCRLGFESNDSEGLAGRLDQIGADLRLVAYEGAGMSLALVDFFPASTRPSLFAAFLDGAGFAWRHPLMVGLGWALSGLGRPIRHIPAVGEPVGRWFAIDGYAFHLGFFDVPKYLRRQALPDRLPTESVRCFDHGLGRLAWLADGADPARVTATLAAFPSARRPHLWAGVGIAASTVGPADRELLRTLLELAGPYRLDLATGALKCALVRENANAASESTELACEVLCSLAQPHGAELCRSALENLPAGTAAELYDELQRRLKSELAKAGQTRLDA